MIPVRMVLLTSIYVLMGLALSTQDFVNLDVSPTTRAECREEVVLGCAASSSTKGLSVKLMAWYVNNAPLCTVNSSGTVQYHEETPEHLRCMYEPGNLSLILGAMTPLQSGESNRYVCKLRANHGTMSRNTTVELQECCGTVEEVLTQDRHTCTFRGVHPGGEVRWFDGAAPLIDDSVSDTAERVEKHGWVTISRSRKLKGSDGRYNCSLISTESGQEIPCRVQRFPRLRTADGWKTEKPTRSGSQRIVGTFFACAYTFYYLLSH